MKNLWLGMNYMKFRWFLIFITPLLTTNARQINQQMPRSFAFTQPPIKFISPKVSPNQEEAKFMKCRLVDVDLGWRSTTNPMTPNHSSAASKSLTGKMFRLDWTHNKKNHIDSSPSYMTLMQLRCSKRDFVWPIDRQIHQDSDSGIFYYEKSLVIIGVIVYEISEEESL